MHRRLFEWRFEREIYNRVSSHLRDEGDYGYPFVSREEMKARTRELDVQPLLDAIEEHIRNMPAAYGESFRYIMHRDLRERFRLYERLARRRVQPNDIDSRLIATRLEPSR
jgi:hypothetical protein